MEIQNYSNIAETFRNDNFKLYVAKRNSDNKKVLLKIPAFKDKNEISYRYKTDYYNTSQLQSTKIVQIPDIINENDEPILILEDFGGMPLLTFTCYSQLTIIQKIQLAIKMAEAVGFLHDKNIIHTEIRPENFFYNSDSEELKITNLASAIFPDSKILPAINLLKYSSSFVYISPEQTNRIKLAIDHRTDIYSLGICFYELFTGESPFTSIDWMNLLYSHLAEQAMPVHQKNIDIPQAFSGVIMKMIRKNPDERYQSVYGLICDLEYCLKILEVNKPIEEFELGRNDISRHFIIPDKLYGRQKETKHLFTLFESVLNGSKEILLVTGPSGIGKTSLIKEIQLPLISNKGYFLEGKFDQVNKNTPYSAIKNSFSILIHTLLGGDDKSLAYWKETIKEAVKVNGQVIADIIPEIKLITGNFEEIPELSPKESQNRFNSVFKDLIKALGKKSHPVALFIDDIQWADDASLNLIYQLLEDNDLKYIFIIGALRNKEVEEGSPFAMFSKKIISNPVYFNEVEISPINQYDIQLLISETLKLEGEDIEKLAKLVHLKTGGNPFFVKEILKSFYLENIIYFKDHKWRIDLKNAKNTEISDNLVNLMTEKLKKLPESILNLLKSAGTLGVQFKLDLLAQLENIAIEKLIQDLHDAFSSGILILDDNSARFSHDKLHEAIYSMLSESEKENLCFRIGLIGLSMKDVKTDVNSLFYFTNYLNKISKLLNKDQLIKLIELNSLSGSKSKAIAAYHSAAGYFSNAAAFISVDSWKSNYSDTLFLYNEWAESEYLAGNITKAENLIDEIFRNSKSPFDKIKAYEIRISYFNTTNEYAKSIALCREALKLLDFKIPKKANTLIILKEILEVKFKLKNKKVEDLLLLPEITDPHKIAIARILMLSSVPAYIAYPEYLPIIVLRLLKFTLKYGTTSYSAFAYAIFGLISLGALGNIDQGFQFGELAYRLVEKMDLKYLKSKIFQIHGGMVSHFKKSIHADLDYLLQGTYYGYQTGDLEFAGYTILHYINNYFFCGGPLDATENEALKYYQTIIKYRQNNSLQAYQLIYQTIVNLQSDSIEQIQLNGNIFNRDEVLPIWQKVNNKSNLSSYHICQAILYYFSGNFKDAITHFEETKSHLDGIMGMFFVPVYYFYYSLCLLAEIEKVDLKQKKKYRIVVSKNLKKLENWSHHAPMNFENKYLLVKAELARIDKKFENAFKWYSQSIELARLNGFLPEEAIANELMFHFLGQNKLVNNSYRFHLIETYKIYKKWNHRGKIMIFEADYPQIINTEKLKPNEGTILPDASDLLDLNSIIRALQSISEEININQLLSNILKIAYTNSGANKGILILNKNNRLLIEQSISGKEELQMVKSLPLDDCSFCSQSIIHYVYNTSQTVIVDDANNNPKYKGDDYLIKNSSKSIFCIPIERYGRKLGILYLENTLIKNAFTDRHIETLKILCSQAAISIENAEAVNHLKEEHDFSSKLIQNSPAIITGVEKTGKTIFVNPTCYKITGYNPEELIGKNWWTTFYPGAYYSQVEKLIKENYFTKATEHEMVLVAKDGSERILSWNTTTIKSPEGEDELIIGFGNDITERKLAQEKLYKNEELFRATFEQAPIGIVNTTLDGKLIRINHYFSEFLGYTSEELLGKHFKEFTFVDDVTADIDYMDKLLKGEINFFSMHKRYIRKDKSLVWANLTVSMMKDKHGNNDFVIGTVENITEQKRMQSELENAYNDLNKINTELQESNSRLEEQQESLISAKEKAEKSDKLKTAFLQNMSHEIRTPMNGIIGFSSMLSEKCYSEDEKTRFIGFIEKSSNQLLSIVTDILDISQIEAGYLKINYESCELDLFMNDIYESFVESANDKSLSLELIPNYKSVGIFVETDLQRLRQIFNKLLNNAIKFTHKGFIKFGYEFIDNEIQFFVTDTGIGIPQDMHITIFERFRQGQIHMDPRYGGTGLGLSITEKLVKLLNGRIWINSEVGKGSSFFFTIPFKKGKVINRLSDVLIKDELPYLKHQNVLILVAEDDDLNFQLIKSLFDINNIKYIRAYNGIEAVECCKNNKDINIVLMDLKLPLLNGLEATRQIKKIRTNLPIIAHTAFALSADKQDAFLAGCDDYITKPIKSEKLFAVLNKFI